MIADVDEIKEVQDRFSKALRSLLDEGFIVGTRKAVESMMKTVDSRYYLFYDEEKIKEEPDGNMKYLLTSVYNILGFGYTAITPISNSKDLKAGRIIMEVFEMYGLDVFWDGKVTSSIFLKGLK